MISANRIAGVYILGGQSVGNLVEGNLIGYAANGTTRAGNGQYGVLLYNAPANTVVRSGPNANRITGSGIANFREFTGRRVSANPTGGRKSQQPTPGRRVHRPSTAQRRVVVGQPTPAGPARRKAQRKPAGKHRDDSASTMTRRPCRPAIAPPMTRKTAAMLILIRRRSAGRHPIASGRTAS